MSAFWRDLDPNCPPQRGTIWINGKCLPYEVFRDPYKVEENARETAKDNKETDDTTEWTR